MFFSTVQRLVPDLVERAAEICGGIRKLAEHLGVEEHRVSFWRQGTATAPNSIVVQLVDLILKDDIARAAADRRKELRTPPEHSAERPRI